MRRFCLTLALALLPLVCRADRLLFSRGEGLFLSELSGQSARKLAPLGRDALWGASRDGRRVAWLKRLKGAEDAGLGARPAAFFLADTAGRRQKKLASTDGLKDKNGLRVTEVGPTREGGGVTRLDDWLPASLSFSFDGRTLYLGLSRAGNAEPEVATVALDAFTGSAVVDADGRWKVLAPIAQADAGEDTLVGAGTATATALSGADALYLPVTLVRFATESVEALPPAATLNGKRPPYGTALWPTLDPSGKRIAFSSLPAGLWKSDLSGKSIARLLTSDATRPRFSLDGKLLYFLSPRPSGAERPSFDLFRLDLSTSGAPTRQCDDIDWFDILPD